MLLLQRLPLLLLLLLAAVGAASSRPNVIVVFADDLGSADVSYNYKRQYPGQEPPINTPNIDALANEAVRMTQYYMHPVCTPSRAAFVTGRYSHSVGMPGVGVGPETGSIDPKYPIISETFKKGNYHTHMVGKWHLGLAKSSFTPLGKGFDTFFGLLGGGFDYWEKRAGPNIDLHNGTEPYFTEQHATAMLTDEAIRLVDRHASEKSAEPFFMFLSYNAPHDPLQPEPRHEAKCHNIKNTMRREYCGLVVGVDEGVGNLTAALRRNGQLDNTIIVFSSDNGGMPSVGGLNHPYRGSKISLYEGGVRCVSFIRAPQHLQKHYDYNGLAHVSDWYPTLVSMAGISGEGLPFEGHDLTSALAANATSPRTEVVLNMDELFPHTNRTAYRDLQYKIIRGVAGDAGIYHEPVDDHWHNRVNGFNTIVDKIYGVAIHIIELWFGQMDAVLWEVVTNIMRTNVNSFLGYGHKMEGIKIFDMVNDPYETTDLAKSRPDLVAKYTALLDEKRKQLPPTRDWMLCQAGPVPFTTSPRYPGMKFWYPWLAEDVDLDSIQYINVFHRIIIQPFIYQFLIPVSVAIVLLTAACLYSRSHRKSPRHDPAKKHK